MFRPTRDSLTSRIFVVTQALLANLRMEIKKRKPDLLPKGQDRVFLCLSGGVSQSPQYHPIKKE
jgi:hypothetical protein